MKATAARVPNRRPQTGGRPAEGKDTGRTREAAPRRPVRPVFGSAGSSAPISRGAAVKILSGPNAGKGGIVMANLGGMAVVRTFGGAFVFVASGHLAVMQGGSGPRPS